MLNTERDTLQTALTKLRSAYASTTLIYRYLSKMIDDVNGEHKGNVNASEATANVTPTGILATTVAALPASPATNDEAIATDATVLTNATTVAGGGANRVLVRYNGANSLIV